MMGTFVAVYKFFINALPLIPNNKLPEILRYTPPAAQSEFDPHSSEEPLYMKRREEKRPEVEVADKKPPSRDVFVRKPVARWHAVVAGALAGLAVAFETPDRRLTIAQQIFVRYRVWKFNIEDIKELISWEKTTPANKDRLMARLEAATKGHFGPHFAPCEAVHPFFDSCKSVPLDRFIAVSSWMVPIYGALHFITNDSIQTKRGELYTNDSIQTKRVHETTVKDVETERIWNRQEFSIPWSVCAYFCFKHNLYLAAGLSLLVEDKRRRGELAMYVLPRGLESAWGVMRRRGWVPIVPGGENLLCAMGMGMVMATYQTSPQHLSGMVRRIMYQFIGPN
ncbi:hypothetical protein RhiXN_04543 [Rhizoctonia solani]|uniref:Uncharacterized protein n=1 Tax=Rhizoctonia solani TaxID=456999 RepID=A0A8H8STP9_9AGAM|nr:uncharacterized protein RhiXN_04543 [Rhizoctonia solani]QRW16542.1 hypothetical protein RhiXN_04543 [Rhizoctonia solani]